MREEWIFWIKLHRIKIIGVLLILAIGGVYGGCRPGREEELLLVSQAEQEQPVLEASGERDPEETETTPSRIQVDVKGAVKHPGVMELTEGARVHEAIDKAGGPAEDADLLRVNLAAVLQDGQVVYVPRVGEEEGYWPSQTGQGQTGEKSNKININTATQAELEQLPGIGPSKAQAIIQHREEHGAFADPEQLLQVPGIGQKTLEKLLPLIRVK